MSKELTMPVMAESIVEAEILKWLVKEGDTVTEGQMIAEVMTDKVTTEIPSPFGGKIEKIVAKEGSVVQVKGVIAIMADDGSSAAPPAETAAPATSMAAADATEIPAGAPASPEVVNKASIGDDSQSATQSATNSMFGVNTKSVSMDFGGVAKTGSSGAAAQAGTNKFGRPLDRKSVV